MNKFRLILFSAMLLLLTMGCGISSEDVDATVEAKVEARIASMATPTPLPPTATPYVVFVTATPIVVIVTPTPTPMPTTTPTPMPTTMPTPMPTPMPTTMPTPMPTPMPTTMPTPYTPLTIADLKKRLTFVFETNPVTVSNITVYGKTTRVEERSYREEALAIFTEGYYTLTDTTPEREGWIPRIYSKEEYNALIDEKYGGNPTLKHQVLGWCCMNGLSGLELVIRGDQPLSTVILTLAHEAGHARQRVLNPDQSNYGNDTNYGALREAEAFAFAIALVRDLEISTGINVSRFPDWSSMRSYIDTWTVSLREHLNNLTDEHARGKHLLWLAALSDPTLENELKGNWILSPESLFHLHTKFIAKPAHLVDAYVSNLLESSRDKENMIRGHIESRLDKSVERKGFIKYTLDPVIIP